MTMFCGRFTQTAFRNAQWWGTRQKCVPIITTSSFRVGAPFSSSNPNNRQSSYEQQTKKSAAWVLSVLGAWFGLLGENQNEFC
jgi:hypothetical protein